MIYYLEVRDHRPIDVELRKSNVDSKYADIVITTHGLKGDPDNVTHAEVLIADLELAATSLIRERDRKISGGACDCDRKGD